MKLHQIDLITQFTGPDTGPSKTYLQQAFQNENLDEQLLIDKKILNYPTPC